MERQMVECEDGRRRQARIMEESRDEGGFVVRSAGVRVKGKHVNGEVWLSSKTGTWYFVTDPNGKNSHLLLKSRDEAIHKMREQLKVLEAKYAEERREITTHRDTMIAIDLEIKTLEQEISTSKNRIPRESDQHLMRSPSVRVR